MKTKSKQSKAIVAMAGVIMLLVALSISLTFAFFTAKTGSNVENVVFGTLKTNTTSFGYTKIDSGDLTGTGNAKKVSNTIRLNNVVPGQVLTLSGQMDVVANIDIFVRMKTNIAVTLGADSETAIKSLANAWFVDDTPTTGNDSAEVSIASGASQTFALGDGLSVTVRNTTNAAMVAATATEFEDMIVAAQQNEYARTIRGYIFNSAETTDTRIAGGSTNWLTAAGKAFGADEGEAVSDWFYYVKKVNYELSATGVAAGVGNTTDTGYTFTAVDLDNATIALSTSLNNYWQGATVVVSFDLEAIQAEHAGSAGAQIELTNTPATDAGLIAGAAAWDNVGQADFGN